MQIVRDGYLAHHKTAPPKGCAMTDEKKKDKKENEGVKDAKKIDDEQLKDVAGGTRRKFDARDHVAGRREGTGR
jgi:hypothetical protein